MSTYNTSNSCLNYPKSLVNIITIYIYPNNIDFSTSTLKVLNTFKPLIDRKTIVSNFYSTCKNGHLEVALYFAKNK